MPDDFLIYFLTPEFIFLRQKLDLNVQAFDHNTAVIQPVTNHVTTHHKKTGHGLLRFEAAHDRF